jgi:flagellar motor component MotA
MRIFGLVLALVIVFLGVYTGGTHWIVDAPSAVIVLGLSTGMFMFSGSSPVTLIMSAFEVPNTPAKLEESILAWKRMGQDIVSAGWVGFVIGSIHIGVNLDDLSVLGLGMATALICVFYALTLAYVVCRPIQRRLEDARAQGGLR